jgi:replicative DNA helicase
LTVHGWKRLDELEPGMHVATPRSVPLPAAQTLGDEELALLGHLIGDGCTLPRHAIQYTTRERDLAEMVVALARHTFGEGVAPRYRQERRWFQVYLASTRHPTHGRRSPVAEWLDALGGVWGRRSWEKRVPAAVFAQPATAVGRFLRHLWATDGCIRPGGEHAPAIYYATSSPGLAEDVQALLLRVGVQSRTTSLPQRAADGSSRGRTQHHTVVSGKADIIRFADAVGAVGSYKQTALAAVVDSLAPRGNTNRDILPAAVWDLHVRPAMAAAGVSHRQLSAALSMSYCGSTLFRQNLGRDRALRVAVAVGSEALRGLAESDIYWDQVVAIEPDGEEEVFDLTVPGPHNFLAADLVAHNSIEQDADMVAFVYRDEVYNQDDPSKKGLAELIIAKHRNGETGTVDLVFLGETTTFKSRAPDHFGGGGAPFG